MTHGKFDGVLICSDMDGTLAIGTNIVQRNLDAIAYFTAEGGKFTISSGRDHDYLEKIAGGFCNAPYICLNGAMIYDAQAGQVLFDEPMSIEALNILTFIKKNNIPHKAMYMYIGHGKDSVGISLDTFSADDFGSEPIYKILLVIATEEETLAVKKTLSDAFPAYQFTRSWYVGLEIMSKNAGKGVCVKQLKKHLGAKTLICVGDFENDISMLLAADMAFAPQNAADFVKALPCREVCHVDDGCIADIIEILPSIL